MSRVGMLMGLLSMLAQAPPTPVAPSTPEVVRVLSIQGRQVDGAARYVAPSLAPLQHLLDQAPGNHFTEIGFHEIEVPYGQEGSVDLGGGGYTLWFGPTEYTEEGEVVFECHIDLKNGDKMVEALRVHGKVARGKGTAFRGLPLSEGEMMVVMSIARAEDHSGTSDSGAGGEENKGTGDGSAESHGREDIGNGPDGQGAEKVKLTPVPELESRNPVAPPEPPEAPGTAASGAVPLPTDMATIESILRALEEQDMQEQKNARRRRYDVVIRGDWW